MKNIIFIANLFGLVACSAQIHLGGTDAASKGIAPPDQVSTASASGVQNNGNANQQVQQEQPAQSVQASNPYTTEASRPKEIAGSFLTDLTCEFRSLNSLACTVYETIDGQKSKVERSYDLQLKVSAGTSIFTFQASVDNSYVASFDLKNILFGIHADAFPSLKFEFSGDLDSQAFSPSFSQPSLQRCEKLWQFPYIKNGVLVEPVQPDGYWKIRSGLRVKLLGTMFSAYNGKTPMSAKAKIYYKNTPTAFTPSLNINIPSPSAAATVQEIEKVKFETLQPTYSEDIYGFFIFFIDAPDCSVWEF